MATTLTKKQLFDLLLRTVKHHGGYVNTARRFGLSVGYLHDVCVKRRTPGGKIVTALGYVELPTRYKKVE